MSLRISVLVLAWALVSVARSQNTVLDFESPLPDASQPLGHIRDAHPGIIQPSHLATLPRHLDTILSDCHALSLAGLCKDVSCTSKVQ